MGTLPRIPVAWLALVLIGAGCQTPLNHQTAAAPGDDRESPTEIVQASAMRDEPEAEPEAVSWLPGQRASGEQSAGMQSAPRATADAGHWGAADRAEQQSFGSGDMFGAPDRRQIDGPGDPSLFRIDEPGESAELVDCRVDPPGSGADSDSLFEPSADALDGTGDEDDSGAATISFRQDARELPSMLWNDFTSLFTWNNAIVLGLAAGGAIAVRDNLDQRVRRETAEHPLRWGEGSKVLRDFGEYSYQVPVLAGIYGLSLWIEDERLHEFSKAVISAYALNALVTVSIKGITNTQRPTNEFENGHYGFPSYHSSSTFAIAAVVDEYYGWPLGLPSYVVAGLVGWSRIDQREHDLSDVLFGSVLGFVIGKTVAAAHLDRSSNIRVIPYYNPVYRASGLTFEMRY